MSALLDSLAAGFQGDATRRQALDQALRDGLPGTRSERWKYTPLRQLERRAFALVTQPPVVEAGLLAHIPAPRIVFANGCLMPALSDPTGLPGGVSLEPLSSALAGGQEALRFLGRRFERGDEVFARLNAALAVEGALLRADAGVASDTPVHLVFLGVAESTDHAWHLRNLVELRAGARLTVVEHHLATGAHAHLANALTHVHLAQGAQLRHARVQDDAARATAILRTDAVLAGQAGYRRLDLELGAGLSRHELNVRLEGSGAHLHANGILLAGGRRHLDTRLGIDHIARETACELTWRGLGTGHGRAAFHGGILIREGADGTDARLSNKNLLLSATAEVDTQPVLEIHADEVQAAHGATVGQLDPQALFYLRSRGLPRQDATRLLTAAFCHAPLAVLEDDALSTHLAYALDQALAREGAA